MTESEFRSTGALREQLRQVINTEAFVLARAVILGKLAAIKVDVSSDALVSVRMLAHRQGYEAAFDEIFDLTHPEAEAPAEPKPDWGVNVEGTDLPPQFQQS